MASGLATPIIDNYITVEFCLELMYLNLRLVNAFQLFATPFMLRSDRNSAFSRPSHDITMQFQI